MANNEIKQKITLDNKEYKKAVDESNEALASATTNMNKQLVDNSKQFSQNESQVKKWATSFKEEMKNAGKAFMENVKTGAKAVTLDAGFRALHKASEDAVEMAMDASKTFADLRSRIGASEDQMSRWEKAIGKVAISSKANLGALEGAFADLSDSVDPEKMMEFLDTLGQATQMAGNNPKAVSDFVKNSLLGQGKDINKANVNELMGGADLLRRQGRGFGSLESSMSALGGLDQKAIRAAGLSERDVAAMLAAASQTKGVSSGGSVAAINDLLGANSQGNLNALSSVLGVNLSKNGKLDLSNLGGAVGKTRLGGDERTSREIFKQIAGQSGMSAEGANALFDMIRNAEQFGNTMKKAKEDTQTFAQSAAMSSDNIKDAYQGLQNTLVVGFKDIFGPIMKPLKSAFGGDIGGAMGQAPGALMGAVKGIADHPMLAAGSVLGLAGGGALISNLLGKIPGLGGSVAGMAGGVAKGKAMEAAGVTPVYVVNASEIGGGGVASALSGAGGFMGKMGGLLGKAGMVGAAGSAGYALGTMINNTGVLDAPIQGLLDKLDRLTDGMLSGVPNKMKVEIDSKDPQFMARPKATDNQREGRAQ